jgi:hypothetical protein
VKVNRRLIGITVRATWNFVSAAQLTKPAPHLRSTWERPPARSSGLVWVCAPSHRAIAPGVRREVALEGLGVGPPVHVVEVRRALRPLGVRRRDLAAGEVAQVQGDVPLEGGLALRPARLGLADGLGQALPAEAQVGAHVRAAGDPDPEPPRIAHTGSVAASPAARAAGERRAPPRRDATARHRTGVDWAGVEGVPVEAGGRRARSPPRPCTGADGRGGSGYLWGAARIRVG